MAAYDFGSMSLEQLGNIKITSGKHKGLTVAEAWVDSSYVSWCSDRVSSVGEPLKALVTYDFRNKFGSGMPPITTPKAKVKMFSAPPVAVHRAVIELLQEADFKGLIDRVAVLEGQLASVARQNEQLAMAVQVQASQLATDVVLATWFDEPR